MARCSLLEFNETRNDSERESSQNDQSRNYVKLFKGKLYLTHNRFLRADNTVLTSKDYEFVNFLYGIASNAP